MSANGLGEGTTTLPADPMRCIGGAEGGAREEVLFLLSFFSFLSFAKTKTSTDKGKSTRTGMRVCQLRFGGGRDESEGGRFEPSRRAVDEDERTCSNRLRQGCVLLSSLPPASRLTPPSPPLSRIDSRPYRSRSRPPSFNLLRYRPRLFRRPQPPDSTDSCVVGR